MMEVAPDFPIRQPRGDFPERVAAIRLADMFEGDPEAIAAGPILLRTPEQRAADRLADAAALDSFIDDEHARSRAELDARLAADPELAAQLLEFAPQLADVRIRAGVQALADVSTAPPGPLLCGRIDPRGHTILYGAGGSGKGAYTTSLIVRLVRDGLRVLIVDYENHPEEWARRYAGLAGRDGSDAAFHVAPLATRWHGVRGPIWQQADDLRALADELVADVVIVDSIVPACGGADPMEPGTPARYAEAIERIERPVLSLGHVTKGQSLEYPYASVFFHNLARMTWSLHRDGERLILTHRKANNYERQGRYVVDMVWFDGKLGEVTDRSFTVALAERIDDALADGPLTVEAIVARLNDEREDGEETTKPNSVRVALRRGLRAQPPRYHLEDGRWRREDPS